MLKAFVISIFVSIFAAKSKDMANYCEKTLFNRNHIIFKKIDNGDGIPDGFMNISGGVRNSARTVYLKHPIKKESKLGFWYLCRKKTVCEEGEQTQRTILRYHVKDSVYELSYYTMVGDVKANVDIHPWELVSGDGAMPQSQIDALRKIVDSIVADFKEYDIKIGSYDATAIKRALNQDLFGDPRGIKMQSDEEKIISHGFDTKISFRNRKEKA